MGFAATCKFTGTPTKSTLEDTGGIRANAIAPGFRQSETNLRAPAETLRQMDSKAALGRGALPEEQAHVAAFLVSDRASPSIALGQHAWCEGRLH